MSEKFKLQPGERITSISVPDEEVVDWIKTLQEGGFDNAEIDSIMAHLNRTYKEQINNALIDRELAKIRQEFEAAHNQAMPAKQLDALREVLQKRFNR